MQAIISFGSGSPVPLIISATTTRAALVACAKASFAPLKDADDVEFTFVDPEDDGVVVKISKDEHWKAAFDMFQQSSLKRMRLSATAAILAHSASVQPPLPFPASAPAASSSAKRPRSDSAEAAADAREKKKAKSDEDEKGGEDEKGDDDVLDAKHDDSKGKKDKAAVVKSSKSSGTEPKKAKGKSQVVCAVFCLSLTLSQWTPSHHVKGLISLPWEAATTSKLEVFVSKSTDPATLPTAMVSASVSRVFNVAVQADANAFYASQLPARSTVRYTLDLGRALLSRIFVNGGQYLRHPMRIQCPLCGPKPVFRALKCAAVCCSPLTPCLVSPLASKSWLSTSNHTTKANQVKTSSKRCAMI